MNLLSTIFLLVCQLLMTECAKILFLIPVSGKSHKNFFKPLAQELATRGHAITIITPFKDEYSVENIREITIKANFEMMKNISEEMMLRMLAKENAFSMKFFQMSIDVAENFLNDYEIQSELEKGIQYDLAFVHLFLNEVGLMTASMFAKHVAIIAPVGILLPAPSSPPLPLAAVSTLVVRVPNEMNFIQRLKNVIASTFLWNLYKYVNFDAVYNVCQKYNHKIPTVDEAKERICLSLINADPVMNVAKPEMPNVVSVGNMHCRPPKNLPKELSDFVESSGEAGFIYFSLGSVFQGKYLPEKTQKEFLKAFSRLKQKVIWKYEDKVDNLPSNVMVTPWAPQQDILGHPKIRLFLSHGGILSCQETIYHGVPVIGIPIFGDQIANVDRLVEIGVGDSLEISNITAEEVYEKIQKILNDPKYLLEVKRLSLIANDQSVTSMETAVFWTEYIIRHNGADHLRSSAEHLDHFQYFCLDILTTVTTVIALPLFVLYKIIALFIKKYRK